jgi:hypothetical protein
MLLIKTPIGDNIAGFDYTTPLLNYTARLWYIDTVLMKRIGGLEEEVGVGVLESAEEELRREFDILYEQSCLSAFSQTFFSSILLSQAERDHLVRCCLKANHKFGSSSVAVGSGTAGAVAGFDIEQLKSFTMQNVYSVSFRDKTNTWTSANENNLNYLLPCLRTGINLLTADTSSSLSRN